MISSKLYVILHICLGKCVSSFCNIFLFSSFFPSFRNWLRQAFLIILDSKHWPLSPWCMPRAPVSPWWCQLMMSCPVRFSDIGSDTVQHWYCYTHSSSWGSVGSLNVLVTCGCDRTDWSNLRKEGFIFACNSGEKSMTAGASGSCSYDIHG